MGNHLKTTSVNLYFPPGKCLFVIFVYCFFFLNFCNIFLVNKFDWLIDLSPERFINYLKLQICGNTWSTLYIHRSLCLGDINRRNTWQITKEDTSKGPKNTIQRFVIRLLKLPTHFVYYMSVVFYLHNK